MQDAVDAITISRLQKELTFERKRCAKLAKQADNYRRLTGIDIEPIVMCYDTDSGEVNQFAGTEQEVVNYYVDQYPEVVYFLVRTVPC